MLLILRNLRKVEKEGYSESQSGAQFDLLVDWWKFLSFKDTVNFTYIRGHADLIQVPVL